jgi:hypothetical protein
MASFSTVSGVTEIGFGVITSATVLAIGLVKFWVTELLGA